MKLFYIFCPSRVGYYDLGKLRGTYVQLRIYVNIWPNALPFCREKHAILEEDVIVVQRGWPMGNAANASNHVLDNHDAMKKKVKSLLKKNHMY